MVHMLRLELTRQAQLASCVFEAIPSAVNAARFNRAGELIATDVANADARDNCYAGSPGGALKRGLLMSTSVRTAAMLIPALVLAACAQTSEELNTKAIAEKVTVPGFVPGVPNGFQCPLVPNGFDPVGSIYRLDKSGTFYRVVDFSADPAIKSLTGIKRDIPVGNYSLSDKQTASAGLSFEVLKTALPGLATNGTSDFKKDVSVNIVVEDIMAETIDDSAAQQILEKFKTSGVKPVAGNTYYLVREAVKAGSVSYTLKQDDVAKMGGKAQMEGLAKGSANVTFRDDNGAIEIKQKFLPNRIPVCVKPSEIVFDKARSTATSLEATLKSPETTAPVAIKKVGVN
jgi:hypothetical protein